MVPGLRVKARDLCYPRPVAGNPRIDDLRKRIERDPQSRLFAQLAEELRKDGDLAEAIEVARAGLKTRHPSYPSARMTLGRALLDTGDTPRRPARAGDGRPGRARQHPGRPAAGRVPGGRGPPRGRPRAVPHDARSLGRGQADRGPRRGPGAAHPQPRRRSRRGTGRVLAGADGRRRRSRPLRGGRRRRARRPSRWWRCREEFELERPYDALAPAREFQCRSWPRTSAARACSAIARAAPVLDPDAGPRLVDHGRALLQPGIHRPGDRGVPPDGSEREPGNARVQARLRELDSAAAPSDEQDDAPPLPAPSPGGGDESGTRRRPRAARSDAHHRTPGGTSRPRSERGEQLGRFRGGAEHDRRAGAGGAAPHHHGDGRHTRAEARAAPGPEPGGGGGRVHGAAARERVGRERHRPRATCTSSRSSRTA